LQLDLVRGFRNASERSGMSSKVSGVASVQSGQVPPPPSHHAQWFWRRSGVFSHGLTPHLRGWSAKQIKRPLTGSSSTQSFAVANAAGAAKRPARSSNTKQVLPVLTLIDLSPSSELRGRFAGPPTLRSLWRSANAGTQQRSAGTLREFFLPRYPVKTYRGPRRLFLAGNFFEKNTYPLRRVYRACKNNLLREKLILLRHGLRLNRSGKSHIICRGIPSQPIRKDSDSFRRLEC